MRTRVQLNIALFALGLVHAVNWPFASASVSPSSPTSSVASYSHAESSEGGRATREMYDINYRSIKDRQLAPTPAVVLASSSFDWWPYPPQTFVAPAPVTTTDTPPTLLLSFDTTSTALSSTTALTSSLSSSSSSNSSSSTPTSTSMITLTPHPSQTTTSLPSIKSLPKNDPKAQSRLTYIIVPLFALFGIILGSVAAWLVYGCLTRKPKMIRSFGIEEKEIGGPRYVPTAGNDIDVDVCRDGDVENGRYHAMTPGPVMQEVNLDGEEGRALFGWPSISRDRGRRDNERCHTEDDPFLLPPTQHKPKTRSSKSTRSIMSNATSLAFLELYESDEEALDDERWERLAKKRKEEADIPWESLRHKSIKRGILERVRKEAGWIDSLRGVVGSSFSDLAGAADVPDTKAKNANVKKRHTHVRGDSDLRIEDLVGRANDGVSVPDKVRVRADFPSMTRPLLSTVDSAVTTTTISTTKGRPTYSRANSSRTSYNTTSPDGKGFRILTESPLLHPPPLHSHTSHVSQSDPSDDGGYWWWGEASAEVDRYTAVPVRLCRTRSQSRSRSTSPVKLNGSGGGGKTAGRRPSARDVLPQSPPRIMSPMLEDRLLFTPTPGHGRSVNMTATPPWGWGTVDMTEGSSPTRPQRSRGGEKGKGSKPVRERGRTLRSPHPPSSLPFPRDPDRGLFNSPQSADMFRGRLVKQPSPSRKTTGDKPLPRQLAISGVGGGDRDGAGALERVGEIVKQGWSTRELQLAEDGMSLSPTGFGRMV